MPAATVATRYAPCWPVGQNLCNNRPLIWGGAAPAPLPPRSAARPCPTRPCLPSSRRWLSSSFARQSPPLLSKLFWAFSVKMYVAKAVLHPAPPKKRGGKNCRCHNGCQTMAGGTLAQDMTCPCARALLPVFLVIFFWHGWHCHFLPVCTHLAIFFASAMFSARLAAFFNHDGGQLPPFAVFTRQELHNFHARRIWATQYPVPTQYPT